MAAVLQRVRYLVLEAMYEAEASGHDPVEVFDRRIEESGDEEAEDAVRHGPAGWGRGILRRVWASREEVDRLIALAAPRYPVETLPVIDRNILRLAIWELRDESSAPVAAVINEAVELARRYGGERSPAFVHGVLGTVSRTLHPADMDGPAPP
jgi:N utilization substance protein B